MGNIISIAFQLTATGMLVVFSGLVLLFVLMTLFKQADQSLAERRAARMSNLPTPTPAPDESTDAIHPEIIAAISASVALAVGKKVRIQRIRYRTAPVGSSWSRQGRVTIMGSHFTKR